MYCVKHQYITDAELFTTDTPTSRALSAVFHQTIWSIYAWNKYLGFNGIYIEYWSEGPRRWQIIIDDDLLLNKQLSQMTKRSAFSKCFMVILYVLPVIVCEKYDIMHHDPWRPTDAKVNWFQ